MTSIKFLTEIEKSFSTIFLAKNQGANLLWNKNKLTSLGGLRRLLHRYEWQNMSYLTHEYLTGPCIFANIQQTSDLKQGRVEQYGMKSCQVPRLGGILWVVL